MTLYLDILTIVSIGLQTGTEFAVSVFINPVLYQLDDRALAFAVKLFANKLGAAMPFWYCGNFILLMTEAIFHRSQPGVSLLIASCAVWATVILLTLIFLVPINNRIVALKDPIFSEAIRQDHKRWDARHRIRIGAIVLAMILLLMAVLKAGAAI
jgi:hypothetical protein